jgi:hypothetical protein
VSWIKKQLAKLLVSVGPAAVAYLLSQIDPTELASKLKPYLKNIMDGMTPAWKKNFATGLKKVSDFVAELAKE